jgi:V/A-type H+-transporting ATPase subunit K
MEILSEWGYAAALAFAAIGSALGAGTAGMAAVGAWKKCFAQNKPAPFMLVAFVGAPLTQTIYGMILMGAIQDSGADLMTKAGVGILGGIAMGFSAWYQGKAGASASDALAETGKGFGNYIIVLGLIETVALFVMVFLMGAITK